MPTWGLPTERRRPEVGKGADMPENNIVTTTSATGTASTTGTITMANATQGAPAENERTFTQTEMDAIIGERLKRDRAKYADYDELKAKASRLDEIEEASKSELQKAVEERDKLKAELDKLNEEREHAEKVARIAAEKGVDAALLARMSGDVEANAEFLMSRPKYEAVHDEGEKKVPERKPPDIPEFF